jgi:hypothetical protein
VASYRRATSRKSRPRHLRSAPRSDQRPGVNVTAAKRFSLVLSQLAAEPRWARRGAFLPFPAADPTCAGHLFALAGLTTLAAR